MNFGNVTPNIRNETSTRNERKRKGIHSHKAELCQLSGGEMGGWSCTEIIGNADGKWRQNKTRDTTTEEDKEWC